MTGDLLALASNLPYVHESSRLVLQMPFREHERFAAGVRQTLSGKKCAMRRVLALHVA